MPDDVLRARLAALCAEGRDIFERFDVDIRDHEFHSFVAADYDVVLAALLAYRGLQLRFLELGSASGVITIMADLLGFEACGIEIDASLVATARALATRFDSGARFVVGDFLPTGYVWRPPRGEARRGPRDAGPSGYLQLQYALDDFDVVFGYPWPGEEPEMLDLMRCYGRADGLLLLHSVEDGVRAYRGGREVTTLRGTIQ